MKDESVEVEVGRGLSTGDRGANGPLDNTTAGPWGGFVRSTYPSPGTNWRQDLLHCWPQKGSRQV